jgi:hypothetical protein
MTLKTIVMLNDSGVKICHSAISPVCFHQLKKHSKLLCTRQIITITIWPKSLAKIKYIYIKLVFHAL